MSSIVCTLFEGQYHYGVAALINSLYKNGFRGDFYAGYRGTLPEWVMGKKGDILRWKNCTTIAPAEGLRVHFLPQDSDYHFCNYKPDFVIDLCENLDLGDAGVFYFDPDIVIKCRWSFYEEWLSIGVPLVHEITNNDMPRTHPVRRIWEKIIQQQGLTVTNQIGSYLNSGFWGVRKKDIGFAYLFKQFVQVSENQFNMNLKDFSFELDRSNPFFAKDQDAFNIAAMCTHASISEYGPEGMDLVLGGMLMSHAIGTPKPWRKKYVRHFFKGSPPTVADKAYWENVNTVIKLYPDSHLKMIKASLKATSFLGRFYRRY